MEDYKIIQIIPNNKELYAKYKDDINGGFFTSQIVCFALVEDKDGDREVIPMDITSDGEIHEISRDQLDCIVEKPLIYEVKKDI